MKLPKAKKDLGQHFLINQEVIDDITSDFIEQASSILEIGPGPGILTEFINKRNTKDLEYTVIEKDLRFKDYLKDYVKEENIIFGDALKFDLSTINLKGTWLVSNLPYNISAPLTIKFLKEVNIKYMTLMYQKEVGEKISPRQTKKNTMSSLFALCQNYFECSKLCDVAPSSFSPPPKVDSVVVSFTRREEPIIPLSEFLAFEKFLRIFFSLRRKQLKKVLKPHIPEEKLMNILTSLGKTGMERAETFQLEEVQLFYKKMRE